MLPGGRTNGSRVVGRKTSAGRRYPGRPIAAIGAVIVKGSNVLLVVRGKDPGRGEWSIPGGAIQLGETLGHAVIREIQEEVGIVVEPVDLIEPMDRIICDEKGMVEYHYVLLDFVCCYRSGSLRAGSDVTEARWVSQRELKKYELRRDTRDIIRKGFRMAKRRCHDHAGTGATSPRVPTDQREGGE
jgi:mutator protein MutT